MNLTEYAHYDGLGLATLVEQRAVTPKELGQLLRAAVDRVNPTLNAVLQPYADRVERMSQDDRPAGPFAGVPFLLKDIGAAEDGQLQEVGSRLAQGLRVQGESFLTTRFKQAGLSILGRTAVPEFALSSSTESLLSGATHNPWRLGLIAGGSSGGAAASVAAGIAPIAHASDGAGSIRIPAIGAPTGRLRIGWTAGCLQPGTPVHPEVATVVRQTVAQLATMGHELVEATLPLDYEKYLKAICVGWVYGFNHWLDQLAAATGRSVGPETVETISLACYEEGQRLTVSTVIWAEGVYNQLRRNVGRFFQQYDLLLTPTLTRLPEPLGYYSPDARDVDFLGFFRRCDESCSHLPLFNLTGQPAISLPLGQSHDHLPIGIQLVASFGREDQLIRLASALEEVLPWRGRIPPIHAASRTAIPIRLISDG